MAFELDIFEQVVSGNLAPWLFPHERDLQKHWQDYLQNELTHATRQIHACFLQQDKQWKISQLDARLFDRQQLPAFLQRQQEVQVPEVAGDILLDLLLSEISTDKSSVSEWYHWQDKTGILHLEAYVRIAWESLSFEEQRYCFFQQLLTEQVQMAAQNIRDFVHEQSASQTIVKYLQQHQQALLRYTEQLTENLGDNQPLISSAGNYLLTDVMRLILQQLDSLYVFLIREFSEYLSPDLPVPYSHKVLILNEHQVLVEELSSLLSDQLQDKDLQALLQDVLTSFRAIQQQPTSLRQLAYWQVFLPHLNELLKSQADQPDQEAEYYLTGLTAINFNHPGLLAWGIHYLEQELAEQQTTAGKLDTLYYFQKQIRQIRLVTEHSFDVEHPSLQAQLSDWISEEIRYWQQVAENHTNQSLEVERVPTNMTVAQMALLIRLLQETDLLPTKNKARTFRAFSQVLLSHKQQPIAAESLKTKYHQPDENSIRVLKEKVKAMLDLLDDPTRWQ
jgi:hypothetical protein